MSALPRVISPVTDRHVNASLADVIAGRLQGISPSIVIIGDVVNERRT